MSVTMSSTVFLDVTIST